MPLKVETQVGEVPEEAELADECAQDHDEGKNCALYAPAGRQNPEPGPLLVREAPEHPVPDISAELPRIPNPVAAHADPAILAFVLDHFARFALMLQMLMHAPAQMAKRVDVHGDTPKRPAGRFQPVVSPQFVPIVKLTRQFYFPIG